MGLIFVISIVNGILTTLSKYANNNVLLFKIKKDVNQKKQKKTQHPLNYFYVSQGHVLNFGLLKLPI